jgi:hypothetical protein
MLQEIAMSYRKIEVNGQTYKYVVGRSHVKIQGPSFSKALKKSDVGQRLEEDVYMVTPSNIRDVILGRSGPMVYGCLEHEVMKSGLEHDTCGLGI